MRIKIDGKDIDRGSKITFESSNYSDGQALTIVVVGFALIWMVVKGGLFS